MENLKKFLKNKNTVTILGVLACILILFIGYNMQINRKTALVTVYYANQTIQPKTLITEEMVSRTQVPKAFILGAYYRNYEDIVGKYSNYNTMISEGSLFYRDLLIDESSLPDAVLNNVNEGERVVSFPVNTVSTYGNSMMPGNVVDVYVKLINEGRIVYGEYFENVEILAVKDSAGRNVFENVDENRTPSFIYFSLPEAKYLLFKSMSYLQTYATDNEIEISLVPNTARFTAEDPTATEVTSDYLYEFVLGRIRQIDDQQDLYNDLLNEMDRQKLARNAAANNANTNTNQTNTTNQ